MKVLTIRIGQWARQQSKLIAAVAVGAVIGGVAPAMVRAAIPDTSGVIHGCYTTASTSIGNGNGNGGGNTTLVAKGQLQVIDSAETCPTGTVALNWDKDKATGTSTVVGGFVPNLVGADLTAASLSYRNFSGADLHDATFGGSTLTGADFHDANLSGVTIFSKAKIVGVNFHNTNFTGAVLGNAADIGGLAFITSDVSGANFTSAVLGKVFFDNSIGGMTGTNFTNAQLNKVSFAGIDLSQATLTGVTWTSVTCPDTTNSDANGNTCVGHLVP
jgi:hypothetical protein